MNDGLHEYDAIQRISVIAKLGSLEGCNAYERQIVLIMIAEIAEDTARTLAKNYSHSKVASQN